ncbi:hypothetical protein [Celeribacter neptunius]|uniref:EF hand n=1 Tax=Celeribacter neptunius TaxID=588602 RepID=A0A1I3V762_9RHOB|nr:hypothetical protein [Celeribacter neptunius]SFJ91125.1 EF hand [Celeribacter neptunius]
MKRLAFSIGLMAALPLAASAQGIGTEFMTNWDTDENGQVTLAEVRERRGDLFYMFDADEDGRLNDEEYATFDETRAMDREMHLEEYGISAGPGAGLGRGQGGPGAQGQGFARQAQQSQKGPGNGQRFAAGIDQVQNSMTRKANDLNGDGVVTREEFIDNGNQWFARMDRNRDGVVSLQDFGA